LDVWLNVSCLFKTRSQAKSACLKGQIRINGVPGKPHSTLTTGDRLEIRQGDWPRLVIVEKLWDKPLAKVEARELYTDVTPARPKLDLIDRIMKGPPVQREKGQGRPTKRERRKIDKLSP